MSAEASTQPLEPNRSRKQRVRALMTKGPPIHARHFQQSLRASRGHSITGACIWFIAFMTIDDLALLRGPAWLLAALGVVFWLALFPVLYSTTFSRRASDWSEDHVASILGSFRISGTLYATLAIVALVAWLIIYATAVPPWSP